jgi:hypothetical protein
MHRIAGLVVIALVALLAWTGCESGESASEACLPAAGAATASGANPAAIVLLGDEIDASAEFSGPHQNRLLRLSLPGGRIQAERRIGPRLPNSALTRDDSYRMNAARAPVLAATPDGRAVAALIRQPAQGRDRVVIVDTGSLKTRCSHPLERGVRYTGLLLGRSGAVYAYGSKQASNPRRWHAVLTILDADTGAVMGSRVLRKAARGPWRGSGTDWLIYNAALGAGERRIAVSYHGHDTTGVDLFRISRDGSRIWHPGAWPCVRRPGGDCLPGVTDVGAAHGGVAAMGTGFVATAGEQGLLQLDGRGRLVRRTRVRPATHLMDFASDGRSVVYMGRCGDRPAIQRFEVSRDMLENIPGGSFCGMPVAVHADRFLVLLTSPKDRRAYPTGSPRRLTVVDLEDRGSGALLPRKGAPLGAVIVPR